MSWTWVEPCCGSASIALALLGARRPLLPYQGSKWRFRERLLATVGMPGSPDHVRLADAGPWGVAAPTVIDPVARAGVIARLEAFAARDARAVYDALHQGPVPADPIDATAQFLFLQRLAYSGKAVGDRDGRWVSPGFNTSSAYGLPGTERFGAVHPMIPSLIGVLRGYDLAPAIVTGGRQPARAPTEPVDRPTVVYLDPPYAGSTAYPAGDLSRDEVVALAEAWRRAGARVLISESEPIDALIARGWRAAPLDPGRQDTSRFRGKQAEWLTIGEPPGSIRSSGAGGIENLDSSVRIG